MWTWIGSPDGGGGVTPNSRSITLASPPGFPEGIVLANPLDIFDFNDYELRLSLLDQVASGSGGFPMASGAIYITWYDDLLVEVGQNAVSLTVPGVDELVLDMAGVLFNPPPGATKFGFLITAFAPAGTLTLDNIEIREKNTRSIPADPQNQIVWTKETGGYSYPRSKTTDDLIPVAGSFWVTDAGEHHYFRVIGS
jgi:hypothetical protein